MNFDKFFGILICSVLTSFAAYFVSRIFHAIWIMWAQ